MVNWPVYVALQVLQNLDTRDPLRLRRRYTSIVPDPQVQMPALFSTDAATTSARDLIHALQHPTGPSPLAPLHDGDTAALKLLADIFATTTRAKPSDSSNSGPKPARSNVGLNTVIPLADPLSVHLPAPKPSVSFAEPTPAPISAPLPRVPLPASPTAPTIAEPTSPTATTAALPRVSSPTEPHQNAPLVKSCLKPSKSPAANYVDLTRHRRQRKRAEKQAKKKAQAQLD
jgi:hypothetical protein